jgi:hypothetical protein
LSAPDLTRRKAIAPKTANLSGGILLGANLAAMPHAAPPFALIHLLFALLRRLFGLWTHGKPPARLVRVFERTERTLADAIRATLTKDGVDFPALDDRAFLKWFAKNAPGLAPVPLHRLRGRGRGGATFVRSPACEQAGWGDTLASWYVRDTLFAPTPARPPQAREGVARAPP